MRGGRQSSDVMEQAQQIMNDAGTGETNPAVTGGEMIPQDAQAGEIPGQRTRFLSMVCHAFAILRQRQENTFVLKLTCLLLYVFFFFLA